MKLFEEKPVVHRYEYAAEFIRDFQGGRRRLHPGGEIRIRGSFF